MIYIIISILASLVLYFIAPVTYSYPFCVTCSSVFLISSIALLKNNCKDTLIKFEFFFLFAFFFTNFVYSVFYFPINPYFSLFTVDFNENYINKGTALSSLAASCFCLGIFENKKIKLNNKRITISKPYAPLSIASFMLILFIPYLYTLYSRHVYTTEFTRSYLNTLLLYLIYYTLYAILSTRKYSGFKFLSFSIDKIFIILTGLMVLLLLLIGSRSNPMHILLLSLFLYNFYQNKINNKTVLLIVAVGIVLMGIVGIVRAGVEFSLTSVDSFLDFGNDLTINSRSLYVLMDYADIYGFTFGRTMLLQIFAIIPWGQSFLLSLVGGNIQSVDTSYLVTWLHYGNQPFEVGFGTNLIGDIYVAFGFFGVMVLMFLFGRILRNTYRKACSGSNLYVLIYGLIFMDTIFLSRAGLLISLRPIAWTLLYYQIFNKIFKIKELNKKSVYNENNTLSF